MENRTPEQAARVRIDKMLENAGWTVQDYKSIDLRNEIGVAVREFPTDTGRADYALFRGRTPLGVIEAKREEEGDSLTAHEGQLEGYAHSKLKHINNQPLLFNYLTTGSVTRFTDGRDPKPRSRRVFSFHRPETLAEWSKQEKSLRGSFHHIASLFAKGLRSCQADAIVNLENSFKDYRPRALVQMATGAGKTFMAITSVYRLLKYTNAKRVLFLVDTKNLGEQAEQEFMKYTPLDENRVFTEIYGVQRLKSNFVDPDSHVCISTIQRMYSLLRGEELDESAEEDSPYEKPVNGRTKEVEYNAQIPPEFFDFIIIDECHRSIYDVWKQVLEYFDAFLTGLTATPDNRTYGFFNENVVSEYSHEDAIADGVNVGSDEYIIETQVTKNGDVIKAKEYVEKRERQTRRKQWTQLDEDVTYTGKDLDRSVVNKSQIRNIIRAFKEALPQMFPGRGEVPKTLVFAKSDSHAEDIIPIIREEFNEGDAFCRKITCKAKDPKATLSSFRNDFNPRIAVTVDMIATGTDVKPLECLLFMRDVRSRNYFEQMKGRGTRTFDYDDLKSVSPSVKSAKTGFVIVDAVGVTKSIKTDSRPLERKRSVSLKELLRLLMMGADDDDTFSSIAGRLSRLDRQLNPGERKKFAKLAQGRPVKYVVRALLGAINPDKIEERAQVIFGLPRDAEPDEAQYVEARKVLTREAAALFSPELNQYIEKVRKAHEQIIDGVNLDKIVYSGWDKQAEEKARATVADFHRYIQENKDEIAALKIFYSQPYYGRELTYEMVKELSQHLLDNKPALAPLNVWQAYERLERVEGKSPKSQLVALVSLVRRVLERDKVLTRVDGKVRTNFQEWIMKRHEGNAMKFNKEQMAWLHMIRDHIATSFHIEADDLDFAPFDAMGGLGRMYDLFGDKMYPLFDELNEALSA